MENKELENQNQNIEIHQDKDDKLKALSGDKLNEVRDSKEIENEKIEKEENQTKEKEPLGDRIEDAMDEVMTSLQDFIYGEPKSPTEDIPRMMEDPSGIRRINKIQSRRNFNKQFLTKKFFKVVLIIIGILVGLSLLTGIITFVGGLFAK